MDNLKNVHVTWTLQDGTTLTPGQRNDLNWAYYTHVCPSSCNYNLY